MRRGLTARMLGASGALALVVSAVLVVLLIAIGNLRDAERQAARSESVLAAASDLKGLLLDLETGHRGFIITHREGFLAPWESARAALPALERSFVALERDDPRQRQAAQVIVGAVEAYLHRFSIPLVNLARVDLRRATAVVAAQAGKRRVDAIRAQLGAFAAAETRVAATKRAGARAEARRATAIGTGGLVGILVLIALFVLYLRSIVVEPVRRVAAAAGRLAEGDLAARVKRTEGSDEVADLGQTFNAMAVSLQFSGEELTRQNEELERQRADLADALGSARDRTSVIRAVLDATPDAIVLLDPEGRVLVENPPMHDLREALREAGVSAFPGDLTGEARRDEVALPGGAHVYARYSAPVRDSAERVMGRLVVVRDVSPERRAERLKDELFALVSHELRTPLTSVIGYLELVMDDGHAPLDPEQRRHLEVVDRNATRLLRLVGDLLFAAQAEAGRLTLEPRPVDLGAVVRETEAAARPRAEERGIELEVELATPAALLADRDRIGQVIDNLVSNAIKFTPEEGRVTIRLSAGETSAVLEVTDTGVGIPAEELHHVFERFFRASTATRRAIPGVGLGLTVVKAIVEAHHGHITVRGAPQGGTCFRVELPLAASTADGRAARAGANPFYTGPAAGSRPAR